MLQFFEGANDQSGGLNSFLKNLAHPAHTRKGQLFGRLRTKTTLQNQWLH